MHSPAAQAEIVASPTTAPEAEVLEAAPLFETVYSSSFQPDPRSARDVLAFMLTPVEAFAVPGDDEEFEAVSEMLEGAKMEALTRWYGMHVEATAN
ncbi:MAG: hypothetical protein R2939_14200 [Kofleriaceae bacterium]